MIRIKYPTSQADREQLVTAYISSFKISEQTNDIYIRLRRLLKNLPPASLKELLVMPIDQLINLSLELKPSNHLQRFLKSFFNYEAFQSQIADFFSTNKDKINLKTCYYCNIDFINAFKDIGDYFDGFDFIKRASQSEIENIKWIGKRKVDSILNLRVNATSFKDLKLQKRQITSINDFVLNTEHNHFTLDHILDKASHPISALSLYNFVPCCYACNSKFKKGHQLIVNDTDFFLSPSHSSFNFNDNVKFKILLSGSTSNHQSIKNHSDYVIYLDILTNTDGYERFLKIFKIKGRYKSHKDISLKIIENSQKYSESQIGEFSRITNLPIEQIRSDIFGSYLFDGKLEDKPFTKYARDIAQNIQIKGVKLID